MKKKIFLVLSLVLIMALMAMPVNAAKPAEGPARVVDTVSSSVIPADHPAAELMAGQVMPVGFVYINACAEPNTYEVRYEVTEPGWFLTEIHFEAINVGDDVFIENDGALIPGKFTAKAIFDLASEVTEYSFRYASEAVVTEFAAHAVVSRTECEIDETVPIGTSLAYEQGKTYLGGDVLSAHTYPESVGTYETGRDWTNFISLGFQSDVEGVNTAWIIVEFDMPIQNKDGLDVLVVEDTYGAYPIEKGLVEASQDGIEWFELGLTVDRVGLPDQVESYFDLGSLDWAKFIRVSDKSIKSDFSAPGLGDPNGFDLNAVISLQDNTTCWVVSESAWGEGVDAGTNNWSMVIPVGDAGMYFVESVEVLADSPEVQIPVTAYSEFVLEEGATYKLVVSGTAFAGDTIEFDAEYSITTKFPGDTWTESVTGYTVYGEDLLDLFVNGEAVEWGYYNPTHVYEFILAGNGSIAEFFINDIYCTNNTGSLIVDIYKMP